MTTTPTPTATISTDIAELGGVTGASAKLDALFAFEVFMDAPKKDGKSMQDAFMAGVAWSAAPVAPEPAAAQELVSDHEEAFNRVFRRSITDIVRPLNKITVADFGGDQTAFDNYLAAAPQPLAEVSAAQAVPEAELTQQELDWIHGRNDGEPLIYAAPQPTDTTRQA